ncbi:glycoside hydrolase family 2 TIM barrel-domain containing protein [Algoriphagus sp. C2-6-M1]|uniref:glycoside hydrolase family 2 protein n=1 Tax=Algoriphagus persicinus TaxID=3108754 RepID=UPI002B38F5ED|nr:glycoside hydrolase family 2 TIM barrel-domain containing protein [Algoriphagus sp. C2-6-M1]MEB2779270.1 glycoside hydrolase family 2 TIM barrel-domain containing protein [Algoriphagus sp. C2-6-M1]
MRIFRIWLFSQFAFTFFIFQSTLAQSNTEYQRVYLSGKDAASQVYWDFKVSDGRKKGLWTKILVPSNWEMQGFGSFNYGHDHKNPNQKVAEEIGYYQLEFDAPSAWKKQVINLVFDGAMTDTEVKVNGEIVGPLHQGGFYRFSYDISDFLDFGSKNLLEVKVSKRSSNESVNKAEREADFWIFGGIFRPVFLEILPKNHFTRIAVNAKADGSFEALVTLNDIPRSAEIQVQLIEQKTGQVLGEFAQVVDSDSVWLHHVFSEGKSWNPETPVLYNAHFSLRRNKKILYQKTEKIGFRTVELRTQNGIYVNDVKVVLKGVNRHSFYPTTGRALSEANHLEDILLMKEMNMNAVRMSHYNPDERFLELADSLGLFVLDEVTGWQDGYDTVVGPKLIQEAVLKDANHPSVIAWDHGNEGGWNFENEPYFHQFDIQHRPIVYPWLTRNGLDTKHYPTYDSPEGRLDKGGDIFMPTEILHGLYDGGLGAGLDDFWKKYSKNPLFAGAFLWVFSDEAVKRDDKGGILDSDGNHAPDGILGPYREKEASFYTIKEVWSPIQIADFDPTKGFEGKIQVSNQYLYSDLSKCQLHWSVENIHAWDESKSLYSGSISLPTIKRGESSMIDLGLPPNWRDGDVLKISAIGIKGEVLYTWSAAISKPKEGNSNYFDTRPASDNKAITVRESSIDIHVAVGEKLFVFGKARGNLQVVKVGRKVVNFSQATDVEGMSSALLNVTWKQLKDGSIQITSTYSPYPKTLTWTVVASGELKMEASSPDSLADLQGIGFNYDEEKVIRAKWIGNGPYRVWANRLKGVEFGLWEKEYNNTMTGYSFEQLVYPEFKGFHSDFHALLLETEEGAIEVRSETPNLFLGLFKPAFPKGSSEGTKPALPQADISFLYKIPPMGTKFHKGYEMMSPVGENTLGEERASAMVLWFRFD